MIRIEVGRNMRHKLIISFLVVALVISLGFSVYSYLAMVDRQKMINDIRSEMILAWAMEMDIAGYYLKNATTNVDVAHVIEKQTYGVRSLLLEAYSIVEAGYQWHGEYEFYEPLMHASLDVAGNFIPYSEGAPTIVRHINPTAVEMFGILAEKIWNVTDIIWSRGYALGTPNGVNPVKVLEEKGILDDIVDGCTDILLYSNQIRDFDPKFQ
jgi:hypothetical protein